MRKTLGIKLEGQGRIREMRQVIFYSPDLYDKIPYGKGRHYSFLDPEEARTWSGIYYGIIKSDQCVPVGHSVNANIAMVSAFSVIPVTADMSFPVLQQAIVRYTWGEETANGMSERSTLPEHMDGA